MTDNVISLDSAYDYYNGKSVPGETDTVLNHYLQFISFFSILKLSQDSLKLNSIKGFDTSKYVFVYENQYVYHNDLIKKILATNNKFRSVYTYYCIEMIQTFKNYELVNKNTVDDFAEYFGVLNLKTYKELKKSLF
jgi:hypothetical protein